MEAGDVDGVAADVFVAADDDVGDGDDADAVVEVVVVAAVVVAVVGGDDDDDGYYLDYVAHWTKQSTHFLWEFCDRHLRIWNRFHDLKSVVICT